MALAILYVAVINSLRYFCQWVLGSREQGAGIRD